jgi:hypothetical protein
MDTIQAFWQIDLDSISANGADISLGGLSTSQVILDLGSTFVFGDPGAISNIYSNIPGSAPAANSSTQFTSTHVAGLLLE